MPALTMTVANPRGRGRAKKVPRSNSVGARVRRAMARRNVSKSEKVSRAIGGLGPAPARSRREKAVLRKILNKHRLGGSKRKNPRMKSRQTKKSQRARRAHARKNPLSQEHFKRVIAGLKRGNDNFDDGYMEEHGASRAQRRTVAALRRKVFPLRSAQLTRPIIAKGKKMAKRRGKLKGAAKAAFLRRMNRGRRKAGLKSVRKRRGHRKLRARRNPATRRQRAMTIPQASGSTGAKRARRAKSGSRKRTSVKRGRRGSTSYRTLTAKIHKLQGQIKGGSHKGRKKHRKHTAARARVGVLRVKRRAIFPGVSAEARKYLKAHGLTRVNAGSYMSRLKDGAKQLPHLAAQSVVAVLGFGGLTALGNWAGAKISDKWWSGKYRGPLKAGVTIGSGAALSMAARMHPATSKFAGITFISSVIGAAVNFVSETKVTKDGAEVALSSVLMLPIGSTLLPGMDLGPIDRRLGGYVDPAQFGAHVQRDQFNGYTNRENFGAQPEAVLRRDATLRRMQELRGKDAGGSDHDGTM